MRFDYDVAIQTWNEMAKWDLVMPSKEIKEVTGTYIQDSFADLPAVLAWITQGCRSGEFSQSVKKFCEAQPEQLDQTLVIAESITNNIVRCKIPFADFDHETPHPLHSEVSFELNPVTGYCQRV